MKKNIVLVSSITICALLFSFCSNPVTKQKGQPLLKPIPRIVSASWVDSLMKSVDGTRVVLLDCRGLSFKDSAHIPSAIAVDWTTFADPQWDTLRSSRLFEPTKLSKVICSLGIDTGKIVIVSASAKASVDYRVGWSLLCAGIKNVAILDGGIDAWTGQGLATTKLPSVTPVPTNFSVAQIDTTFIITTAQLVTKLNTATILDARSRMEFTGDATPRSGHLPKAIHLEYIHAFTPTGVLKSRVSFDSLMTAHNISKSTEIIALCEVAVRSSVWAIALREMGYQIRNYDISMQGWRMMKDTITHPIVKGMK